MRVWTLMYNFWNLHLNEGSLDLFSCIIGSVCWKQREVDQWSFTRTTGERGGSECDISRKSGGPVPRPQAISGLQSRLPSLHNITKVWFSSDCFHNRRLRNWHCILLIEKWIRYLFQNERKSWFKGCKSFKEKRQWGHTCCYRCFVCSDAGKI